MHLGQRIRAGIALHAAVNIGFALVVVATTDAPGLVFAAPVTTVEVAVETTTLAAPTSADASTATTVALTTAAPTMTAAPSSTRATTTIVPTTAATTISTTTTAPSPTTTLSAPGSAQRRQVSSTGYCIDGTTASGAPTGPGHAAMNGVAFGSRWVVHDGPYPGTIYEITDRVAGTSEFDIWFASCEEAFAYGRRTITIEQVG